MKQPETNQETAKASWTQLERFATIKTNFRLFSFSH